MPTITSRSAGLRKFIPQPKHYAARYGNFTLTARDIEILETVHRYRYLEARHVRALVGGSDQQITRRLQGLFHNKYVGRYARRLRMRLELDSGAPLMAYGLERKGARALERNCDCLAGATGRTPAPVIWKKDYTRRTEWFLEHHLMVSNFRCVLELALRKIPDTKLLAWDQSRDIWFRVRIPGVRTRSIRVAPDAFFTLHQAGQTRHFFLEADRGTEEHRRIVAKFRAYWWYLQSAEFHRLRGDSRRANVLFATVGQSRLRNLLHALREMPKPNRGARGGKGAFWFCTDTDYNLDDPTAIGHPIWQSVTTATSTRRLV